MFCDSCEVTSVLRLTHVYCSMYVHTYVGTCLHQGIHSVDTFTDVPPFVKYKDRVPDNPELQYKKPSGLDRCVCMHEYTIVWGVHVRMYG